MTLRRLGDRIPNPCPSCGAALVVEREAGDRPTFDTNNLTIDTRFYRTKCEKCSEEFDYDTRTGKLTPAKGHP
jgi:hypothetical protein